MADDEHDTMNRRILQQRANIDVDLVQKETFLSLCALLIVHYSMFGFRTQFIRNSVEFAECLAWNSSRIRCELARVT